MIFKTKIKVNTDKKNSLPRCWTNYLFVLLGLFRPRAECYRSCDTSLNDLNYAFLYFQGFEMGGCISILNK